MRYNIGVAGYHKNRQVIWCTVSHKINLNKKQTNQMHRVKHIHEILTVKSLFSVIQFNECKRRNSKWLFHQYIQKSDSCQSEQSLVPIIIKY